MISNYELAALVYWSMCVVCIFGAGLFFRRGEHARTAFTIMLALLVFRLGFGNWSRGGNTVPDWTSDDRLVLFNAVALFVSYVAFLHEVWRRSR